MSRRLEDLDRALGTVGLRQTFLALFARRHGAVAEQPAVALLILAEQVRDKVVAAAVPLAALGADLHFHRVLPCLRRVPARAGQARLPCLHHGRSRCRTPNSGKDSAALCALLADPVDFQALTPGRHWQATTGRQVAEEIIFEHWFGAGAHILELCSVTTGRVSQREHVAYRMRVRRSGADHLVEQQAYYSTEGGRISWMRVLCSGYQSSP